MAALLPVPALTAAEMGRVDRLMGERFGVDVAQLMEVAGRAVAAFARARFLGGDVRGRRVIVLAGVGNNGGDGLVAARYLHAWGATVEVALPVVAAALRGVTRRQEETLTALGVSCFPDDVDTTLPFGDFVPDLAAADLLIDALCGFGLRGAPTGTTADLIRSANAAPGPTLAVDLPSGLDATTGEVHEPCVRADATLTLALPKTGLLVSGARPVVGELHVADIGIPPQVYAALGHRIGFVFSGSDVVRLA